MKALMCVTVATMLVGGVVSAEAGQKRGKSGAVTVASGGTMVHVSFSNHERTLLREYYAPRYRSLPKGLQKKLRRTGSLPPGWQKKFEPFPVVLERQLVALPAGYHRGVLDGHAVIFNPRNQVLIDVAILF
jgi:hypothetical protein